MAQITSYSTLQSAVTSWLMRGADSTFIADVPTLIQLAEANLKKDPRVRRTRVVDPVSISSETLALPTDFKTMKSLTLTGPTYFGSLDQVSMNELETLKQSQGDDAGVPAYFSIVGSNLYFHKAPSQTYTGRLVYEQTITNLSDTTTTNWLLTNHPDIYLYAVLAEAAPYLKDDNRVDLWKSYLQERLEGLHMVRQEADLSAQAQPATGVVFGG